MLAVSGVANAYCSIDRGPLPVKGGPGYAVSACDLTGSRQAPDDSCYTSGDLSRMEAPGIQQPGDMVAPAARVLAFRVHSPGASHTPSFSFFNHPPLRWEPVFRRVPRLLI